jgi:DNA invertase Pin-like site-specific DNA recombinase
MARFSDVTLALIVKRIVVAKAQFRSLAEPWAETGTSTGRLMLAVLGGLADVERDRIRTRTRQVQGRARPGSRPDHRFAPAADADPWRSPDQGRSASCRR